MARVCTAIAVKCFIPSNHRQWGFPSFPASPLLVFFKQSSWCCGIYPPKDSVWVKMRWFSALNHCMPCGKSADLCIDPINPHSRQKELRDYNANTQHRNISNSFFPTVHPLYWGTKSCSSCLAAKHWSSNPRSNYGHTPSHGNQSQSCLNSSRNAQSGCTAWTVLMCTVIWCTDVRQRLIYTLKRIWHILCATHGYRGPHWVLKQTFSKHNKMFCAQKHG